MAIASILLAPIVIQGRVTGNDVRVKAAADCTVQFVSVNNSADLLTDRRIVRYVALAFLYIGHPSTNALLSTDIAVNPDELELMCLLNQDAVCPTLSGDVHP